MPDVSFGAFRHVVMKDVPQSCGFKSEEEAITWAKEVYGPVEDRFVAGVNAEIKKLQRGNPWVPVSTFFVKMEGGDETDTLEALIVSGKKDLSRVMFDILQERQKYVHHISEALAAKGITPEAHSDRENPFRVFREIPDLTDKEPVPVFQWHLSDGSYLDLEQRQAEDNVLHRYAETAKRIYL